MSTNQADPKPESVPDTPIATPQAAKPTLVIDTNVLIKSANLQELLHKYNLITVPAVIKEVKDPNAKARLSVISSMLRVESSDKASTDQVAAFAKLTGDFVSLSAADFQVISLAVSKIRDKGLIDRLRVVPLQATDINGGADHDTDGDTREDNDSEGLEDDEAPEVEEVAGGENHPQEGIQLTQIDDKKKEDTKIDATGGKEETKGTELSSEPHLESQDKTEKVDADESKEPEIFVDEDGNFRMTVQDDDDGWVKVAKKNDDKPQHSRQDNNRQKESHKKERKESDSISSNLLSSSAQSSKSVADKAHPQLWVDEKDFEKDSEEGWITPSNINNILNNTEVMEGTALYELGVGIMTADYAIQVA